MFCLVVNFSVGPFQLQALGEGSAQDGASRVGEAAAVVRDQVREHLDLGDAGFWKAEVLHKALAEERK